jgi:hypothetical protein
MPELKEGLFYFILFLEVFETVHLIWDKFFNTRYEINLIFNTLLFALCLSIRLFVRPSVTLLLSVWLTDWGDL